MAEVICPNEELERLADLIADNAMRGERTSTHTLLKVALILTVLAKAQAAGRLSPDPDDPRSWNDVLKDEHEASRARFWKERPLLHANSPKA